MDQPNHGNTVNSKTGQDRLSAHGTHIDSFSNTFRCRHLQAISLRNLILPINDNGNEQPATGLPNELSSIVSDEEALSSSDEALQDDAEQASPNGQTLSAVQPIRGQKVRENGTAISPGMKQPRPKRPLANRQISRSMSTAYAEARQRAYEDRILSRRISTFFSLHGVDNAAKTEEQPIYVSEVQATSMNPDFRPFAAGEIQDQAFLRSRRLVLRVWAKTTEDSAYTLLLEEGVVLPELHFVSRDIEYVGGEFHDNTILYHLPDGIYASYPSPEFERRSERMRATAPESKTASFDTLMKLKTLMDVIDDATETHQQVAAQIGSILEHNGGRAATSRNIGANDSLNTVKDAALRVGRDITRLKHEKETKQKRIESRKNAFAQSQNKLSHSTPLTLSLREQATTLRQRQGGLTKDLRSHSARVAEDLLTIFPIEPIPEDPLSFTIRGCHCPHAKVYERVHPPANEQEVAAALGFAATIVDSLSRTLLLHVPYKVHPLGSNSTVRDDITPSTELELNRLIPPGANTDQGEGGARVFPLYAKGADPARFRYAVYLLNRDIEELVTKHGLRVVDVRDTLANIGFLLNTIAGTTRHLPRREAGRVAAFREQSQQPH